jgi:hypothetical protein
MPPELQPNIFCDPPPRQKLSLSAASLQPVESVTPLRKNETMTATAFAFDPALDYFDDSDSVAPRRPQLRLIEGEGYGRILPTTQPVTPTSSVEIYRRRRFLVLLAATALVLSIAWAAGLSITSFASAPAGIAGESVPLVHVVLPGDSYGAIAADLGAVNPVAAGEQLRVANGGSELVVGQRVVVQAAVLAAVG